MIPHEDNEFISHVYDSHKESPLDKLDLTEVFVPLNIVTCRVCNKDTTFRTYYFKDSGTPHCAYCFNFILGMDEDEEE